MGQYNGRDYLLFPLELNIGAKPAILMAAKNGSIRFTSEKDKTFHAEAVSFFICYGKTVFIEMNSAVESVLDNNIEHIIIRFSHDINMPLIFRL